MNIAIKNVTVIGSGLMGAGIAQVAAQTGHNVTMVDINDKALEKAQNRIQNSIQRVGKKRYPDDAENCAKFISESLNHLKITTDVSASVAEADLVVEAIVEDLKTKQKLFTQLDQAAPEHTLFASNTSCLRVSDIARVTKRLDRFGGLHFFNPVPVMKLLEVVRIPETSQSSFESMSAWGQAMGKVTVECKDTPGFIVNRLLIPMGLESLRMIERGDAAARDVDVAMKLGAGFPMGPFELIDYTGIDLAKFVHTALHAEFPDDPLFKPTAIIDKMVAEGKLGMKSGEGFYKYNKL